MAQLVSLKHTCYICHRSLSHSVYLRRHLLSQHQLALPANPNGKRRFDNDEFVYIKRMGSKDHSKIVSQYACPSCLLHFAHIPALKEHVQSTHAPRESLAPNDNATLDEFSVLIPTRKDVLAFSLLSAVGRAQNRPKLSTETTRSLSPLVTVTVSTKQRRLATLASWKTAHQFLDQALQQTFDNLPRWLWKYDYPPDLDEHERMFIKVIQFVLTDFASKCNRKPIQQTNSERTFWVDRVVPLFQIFGDQTGLLSYQWCEVFAKRHGEYVMDANTYRNGKRRYVDGMGYDNGNEERLVMESSSGALKEDIGHTMDDTVKQLHSTMTILNSDIQNHLDASFLTMTQVLSLGVHLVRKTITLSTLRLDNDGKSYNYEEVQSCDIPTSYQDKTKWIRTFDFMAKLMQILLDQNKIYQRLQAEQDGAVAVAEENTVLAKLDQAHECAVGGTRK